MKGGLVSVDGGRQTSPCIQHALLRAAARYFWSEVASDRMTEAQMHLKYVWVTHGHPEDQPRTGTLKLHRLPSNDLKSWAASRTPGKQAASAAMQVSSGSRTTAAAAMQPPSGMQVVCAWVATPPPHPVSQDSTTARRLRCGSALAACLGRLCNATERCSFLATVSCTWSRPCLQA